MSKTPTVRWAFFVGEKCVFNEQANISPRDPAFGAFVATPQKFDFAQDDKRGVLQRYK